MTPEGVLDAPEVSCVICHVTLFAHMALGPNSSTPLLTRAPLLVAPRQSAPFIIRASSTIGHIPPPMRHSISVSSSASVKVYVLGGGVAISTMYSSSVSSSASVSGRGGGRGAEGG